ncbi:MAG TPA: arylsulfatase [Lentisphaeria bacterium]|nr:MAG: hypothetical protein A2X48_02030 [Lentisphaerae bacterium GWF2_49_21]HBC88511.1 arylsulfatase [Lentisphaeria bacterium]
MSGLFADPRKKPNIVFVFSDQQRWDTLGCYGQELPVTPVLDSLAKTGVRFENAFTPQPVCTPARAVIQTGKYASQCGVYWNGLPLPRNEKTLAHYLKEAGYNLGYVGKWHLATRKNSEGRNEEAVPEDLRGGYDGFWIGADAPELTSHGYDGHIYNEKMEKVELKGYRVDAMTDFGLDFIKMQNDSKPFFLFLSLLEPHQQNDVDKVQGPKGSSERFAKFAAPADLAKSEEKGNWQENYPDYLGACNSLDSNVGRIVDELKKRGLYENTIIVYTSDHGCHFKTRNKRYKQTAHESSIRIPLIISGPGFTGGRTVTEMASLIDLAPTILAAAGIGKPSSMPGCRLQDCIAPGAGIPREEVFIQFSGSFHGRAIRTKRWKYSVSNMNKEKRKDPFFTEYEEQFLYDLENDPYELKNLVKDPVYADTRKELSAKLLKYIKDVENIEAKISG